MRPFMLEAKVQVGLQSQGSSQTFMSAVVVNNAIEGSPVIFFPSIHFLIYLSSLDYQLNYQEKLKA